MQSSRSAGPVLTAAVASTVFGAVRLLSSRCRNWLWRRRRDFFGVWPPIGWVRFGNLRRVTPISGFFGSGRGKCIDRYYIENFLARNAPDIHGSVLEIADDTYTRRFGGDRVIKSDVLHVDEGNPKASIVTDISSDDLIAANSFDCIIFTQTLQYIYDVRAAVRTLHRILKPDGILLASFPGISQISRCDMERWGDYWRFTTRSARRLFEEVFSTGNVAVESHGNVLAATGLLQGLVLEDLRRNELDYNDPDYQLVITVRAIKAESSS
jgi:SAM-dependent methyltransferase